MHSTADLGYGEDVEEVPDVPQHGDGALPDGGAAAAEQHQREALHRAQARCAARHAQRRRLRLARPTLVTPRAAIITAAAAPLLSQQNHASR